MRHMLFLFAAISVATVSLACPSSVTCERDCNTETETPQGGSDQGGAAAGGDGPGGANPGGDDGQGGYDEVPPSLADFCDALCACEGCPSGDLESCYEEVGILESDATTAGCASELAAFTECMVGAECVGGGLVFGCTTESAVLDACMTWGDAVCDEAEAICGMDLGSGCHGLAKCNAQCVVGFGTCNFSDPVLNNCSDNCS